MGQAEAPNAVFRGRRHAMRRDHSERSNGLYTASPGSEG